MNKAEKEKTYTLIVKEDLSGYVWLRSAEEADYDTTAETLIEDFAAFGIPPSFISDQGSHFKNKLVEVLSKKLKSNYHFT